MLILTTRRSPPIRELVARGQVRWIADEAQRIELGRVLHYSQIAPRVAFYGKTAEGVLAAFDAARGSTWPTAPKVRFTCTDPRRPAFPGPRGPAPGAARSARTRLF